MKKYLFVLIALLSSLKGISQQQYNVFMDSIGVVHTSTLRTPQVAISGYFSNLLYLPTTLGGYGITDAVPSSRTITINGVSQDLAANRSFTVSPIPYTASTPLNVSANNFTIQNANTSQSGALTSTDWNTFNNKQAVLTAGTGISLSGNTVTNTAPDQTVTLTAGNGIQITGTYPNFTISQIVPTISTPTRSFNSNYTISTTKPSFVFYTVTCSVTNPLVVGTSTASCFLEYSTNAGSTWNSVASIANSSGVGVTVTVQLTNGQTGIVGGIIPANALTRLRTVTSGTASLTFVSAQEIIY